MTPTPSKYFENPAFREYIFLLVELERLIREGRNEGPEGQALYDEMDAPGDKLGPDEVEAVKAFASDLTRLSERYTPILLPTENPEPTLSGAADGDLTSPRVQRAQTQIPRQDGPRKLIP